MCEKILPNEGSSWRFWLYESPGIPFLWHHHPEYEICLSLNSKGFRYIGDHVENYCHEDLVLIGPNLPHSWKSETLVDEDGSGKHKVFVAQIPAQWLEGLVANNLELRSLETLLKISPMGVKFSDKCAQDCRKIFEALITADSLTRFLGLFEIFKLLASDENSQTLSSQYTMDATKEDIALEKIDKVIEHIRLNFQNNLQAKDLAELVHMSVNHFHRFFKKRTEQTFLEFLNELRIGHACEMLTNSSIPIEQVGWRSGFKNTSNFNRRFLQYKTMSPSQYRRSFRAVT